MLKRFILTFVSVFAITIAGAAVLPSITVFAGATDPRDEVCRGIDAATGDGCDSGIDLGSIIRNAINIFSIIIGIVAVIMIMVAGFRYVTAGGDSGNITSAKQTLTYAIIGLVIAALAQVIVQFVLDNLN